VTSITARPIPPTGYGTVAAAVPLSVRVVEEQRDEEEAIESARNAFTAYHPDDEGGHIPGLAIVVLLLAAGTAFTMIRRGPRPRGGAAYARAEVRRERRW
jgi:hypothetical protein